MRVLKSEIKMISRKFEKKAEGYKWVPRETTIEEPKVCPKCKSPYWNTPRKNEERK